MELQLAVPIALADEVAEALELVDLSLAVASRLNVPFDELRPDEGSTAGVEVRADEQARGCPTWLDTQCRQDRRDGDALPPASSCEPSLTGRLWSAPPARPDAKGAPGKTPVVAGVFRWPRSGAPASSSASSRSSA